MSATSPPRKSAAGPSHHALPRGIRNNNAGNVLKSRNVVWRGEAPAAQQTDAEFIVFSAPEWGLRAIARILLSYDKRGVRTPWGIAHRWAPPEHRLPNGRVVKQDTAAYARHLAAAVGAQVNDVLDVRNPVIMRSLMMTIVRHENGQQPYPAELFDKAIDLAGLDAPDTTPAT